MIRVAKGIYAKIASELEKQNNRKIVAIEAESGNYFIGDNIEDAYNKGIKSHPGSIFIYMKIGKMAVYNAYSV